MKIMKEAEIVYLTRTDCIDRIYPFKAKSGKILDIEHKGDKNWMLSWKEVGYTITGPI